MSITIERHPFIEPVEVEAARPEEVPTLPPEEPADPGPAQEGRRTWEYRTVLGGSGAAESVERLNAAGAEGWELVSVVPPLSSSGQMVLYLKRQRRV